jgi:hypothetical protein
MKFLSVFYLALATNVEGFNVAPNQQNAVTTTTNNNNRRAVLDTLVAGTVGFIATAAAPPALASGGATAGKYTTIPIAKRRYYGRVQEAVHEFLIMGPAMIAGNSAAEEVQHFFDLKGTVIVEAKKKDVNGQCTKKDGDCRGKEIRDSRYNDMKASMYLLGNAFRINQQKAPDNLPTVKAAKAFFKEMDGLEKTVTKSPKSSNDAVAQKKFLDALDILDQYLDLVELPPTESGHYDKDFSTLVGESSRIT